MKRVAIVIAFVSFWLPTAGFSQQPPDPAKTGLKVGAAAPEIKLKDQSGMERTLGQLRQDADYLAIVFYRSAGW